MLFTWGYLISGCNTQDDITTLSPYLRPACSEREYDLFDRVLITADFGEKPETLTHKSLCIYVQENRNSKGSNV